MLAAMARRDREKKLLEGWTRREAFAKARGESVWTQPSEFGFLGAPADVARRFSQHVDGPGSRRWELKALDLGPRQVGCVVVESSEPLRLRNFEWSPEVEQHSGPE
jgi:phosphopantetheinyl transferase